MPNYLTVFFYTSCIISLPALLTMLDAMMQDNRLAGFIGLGVFSAFWITFVLLHNSVKYAHAISLAVLSFFWIPLFLYILFGIGLFVVRAGKIDCPGAALIGAIAILFVFIPISLTLLIGIRDLRP